MREVPTKPFRVKLKRVVYAEVVINAASSAEARSQIEQDGPHEWFVSAGDSFDGDLTTIVSIKREITE
ncbi:hypothetical protein R69658_05961 [Paraburkholderia aspalathi]|uniref:Uncharacterized protein n=1 Tax=Paraburkholderia aspalathi TaxID=1324617 RepID=A0ABN7MTZ0_9BURK|nr:hypothetical protein [Paraburkholderia aspalathi]MBK3822233.1 hypothetical protein [Paraburkholderia aspalathi]MBK3834055.1 hypothetical protein [Paraburkholderia aspalathi]MBK3863803.1 hypothetical protein [Paraburkholderia aspalathi]CAE6823562.1 hypothetical protein R69658_05961 [Paraburkholderia aspalathi]